MSPMQATQHTYLASPIVRATLEDSNQMSFPRCLLQLMGERSQVQQFSLKPKTIRPVFQRLTENDVCEFESSQPSHAVGLNWNAQK